MHKKITCIILPRLLFSAYAQSAAYSSAYAAYQSVDYRQAYTALKGLYVKANMEAQYHLGLIYINGQGLEQATLKDLTCLKQSAEKDSYAAAAELGKIYVD